MSLRGGKGGVINLIILMSKIFYRTKPAGRRARKNNEFSSGPDRPLRTDAVSTSGGQTSQKEWGGRGVEKNERTGKEAFNESVHIHGTHRKKHFKMLATASQNREVFTQAAPVGKVRCAIGGGGVGKFVGGGMEKILGRDLDGGRGSYLRGGGWANPIGRSYYLGTKGQVKRRGPFNIL